jgi:hypothetical protein
MCAFNLRFFGITKICFFLTGSTGALVHTFRSLCHFVKISEAGFSYPTCNDTTMASILFSPKPDSTLSAKPIIHTTEGSQTEAGSSYLHSNLPGTCTYETLKSYCSSFPSLTETEPIVIRATCTDLF